MSENGVTTNPVFIEYQDQSPLTREFRNLRVSAASADWLLEITKLASRGHEPRCLCQACRTRRELDPGELQVLPKKKGRA